MCIVSICKSRESIFRLCLKKWRFLLEWERANEVPVHAKGCKQILKTCRLISLLPIAAKVFRKVLYNHTSGVFLLKIMLNVS